MIKLIIFDLDGTLLNTIDDLADSCNHVLAAHGLPTHETAEYNYFVGNGIRKLVERAIPAGHRTPENIQAIYDDFMDYYQRHSADKTAPYEGIIETLEQLESMGIKAAVASNKAQVAMAPLLSHYFPTVRWAAAYGQREGVPTKPAPQIVYDILETAGVKKEEALYIGDTGTDMETAANAGLYKVGAAWGFRTREELTANGADVIIDKPEELLDVLRRYSC